MKPSDRGIAFRHPRAFVEQARGLQEGCEVDRRPRSPPSACSARRSAAKSAAPRASPKNSSCAARGTPKRKRSDGACRPTARRPVRAHSRPADRTPQPRSSNTPRRRPRSSAKTTTQSRLRQAGTTPARAQQAARGLDADEVVERRRHAAGAGGVGAEREARQTLRHGDRRAGTRSAGDIVGSKALRHAPQGERVPTRPVANWSRLVLPTGTAPAAIRRSTTDADCVGV